jgi:hypothetical protein
MGAELRADEAARDLAAELTRLETLSDVIAWGRAAAGRTLSPSVITDVVVQDEFTHDAIVPVRADLVAAVGAT